MDGAHGMKSLPGSATHKRKRGRFAICIALLGLLLATSAVESWHHHDSVSSSPCQICHVVNAPVLPTAAVTELPVPAVSCWIAPSLRPLQSPGASRLLASPRAPPAA